MDLAAGRVQGKPLDEASNPEAEGEVMQSENYSFAKGDMVNATTSSIVAFEAADNARLSPGKNADLFSLEKDSERAESCEVEEVVSFPMSATAFLHVFREVLLAEEVAELARGDFTTIHYAGLVATRSSADMEYLRRQMDQRIETFNQKKAEAAETTNGEFQGHPMFDNFEGYYKVQIGDHIAYRYEITKILGKGSFAQVVECRDHQQDGKPTCSLKITRNTEMDHKFAHKEAQYLQYIM